MMKKEIFKFYSKIIFAAQNEENFKVKLIENPKEAIETRFRIKFPENTNTKILVEDQSDNTKIYVNIPNRSDLENVIEEVELSDEQMELIAGGDIALGIALFSLGLAVYKLSKEMK